LSPLSFSLVKLVLKSLIQALPVGAGMY
jgi:hypothetical protein